MQSSTIEQQSIYTVTRLTREVRLLLEGTYNAIWVEGEVSNFSAPNSGHWYFSLKDAGSQVRCAMFRGNQRKLTFVPKDGMHILVKARVSLYENRGDFQMIVEDMEERGEGRLRRAFEALKKKLEAAGLFDPRYKKPIPSFPTQIGIVTSPTGAAIRDILTVLKRRFHCVPVVIYPTLVQGETAAGTIAKAIEIANTRNECDVIIVARGGGSLEDLWPFNEEIVANAIFQSRIPIISGVGHEVDFTIADFVADIRAATPSAAAEIITPDKTKLCQLLVTQLQQFSRRLQQQVTQLKERLHWTHKHLEQHHPKRRLLEKMQRLDICELNLKEVQTRLLQQLKNQLAHVQQQLLGFTPKQTIVTHVHQLELLQQKLQSQVIEQISQQQTALIKHAAQLDTLSPLATLHRGYAIASKNNHVLMNAAHLQVGDKINVRLAEQHLDCTIEKIN